MKREGAANGISDIRNKRQRTIRGERGALLSSGESMEGL